MFKQRLIFNHKYFLKKVDKIHTPSASVAVELYTKDPIGLFSVTVALQTWFTNSGPFGFLLTEIVAVALPYTFGYAVS
jgi:hypothetical protein